MLVRTEEKERPFYLFESFRCYERDISLRNTVYIHCEHV